jgi:light-regulated signal transduction histidine kinase (bacteriophytochrome)
VSESPAALARQRAFAFLQASWPVAIGIVVLGALLAWTIGHRYTQPMRDLANAANAIGSGDYTRRVEVKHADELGILAAAFNRMGNEIQREIGERQQAEATVRKMNSELEARVRERTTELETANDELQAFSYSVSHDLRSPLRSIDGFSQALLEDYDSQLDDTGKDYLRRLRGGAQRMGHLIDDLLLLSRVTLQPINREDVDLAAMARELIGELHEQDPDRVAHVQIQEGLIALADRGLLWVALQNLIGNAWKFTANAVPAIIEVGARVTDGQTEFFVRDNGAGFDMAYADKLFTPFQRLHSAEEFRGTGIGLATVHRIVARHGGRVWADAAEGRGATFFFTVGGGADGTQHDSAG